MKEKMKLTKSKQFLADAIHASGKGWPDVANWAAQDKDGEVYYFRSKPTIGKGCEVWNHRGCIGEGEFNAAKIPNWHQTCLSREEYFSAYPAEPVADADGWIEWDANGKSDGPVGCDVLVDVKIRCGTEYFGQLLNSESWMDSWEDEGIVAYRLRKPEAKSTAVGDDETNLAAKEELEELERSESPEQRAKLAEIYRPSIEQLMQTYADRAHSLRLANEHLESCTKQASDAMKALSDACKDAGFDIFPTTEKQEPELVITDWRDLRVGDEVECLNVNITGSGYADHLIGCRGVVIEIDLPTEASQPVMVEFSSGEVFWISEWKFIRRP